MSDKPKSYRELWELIKNKRHVKARVLAEDAHNFKRGISNQKCKDKTWKLQASLTNLRLRVDIKYDGLYATVEFFLDEHPATKIERGLIV